MMTLIKIEMGKIAMSYSAHENFDSYCKLIRYSVELSTYTLGARGCESIIRQL